MPCPSRPTTAASGPAARSMRCVSPSNSWLNERVCLVIEPANQPPRGQEFLTRHQNVRLRGHYNDEFQVWIVELVEEDRKLGFLSVKEGRVVEVDLLDTAERRTPTARQLIEDSDPIRELPERFPEAELVMGATDDPEVLGFELVVG